MKKGKNENHKYWEVEKGETIEFGNCFMRCYDKSGKLQFGNHYTKKDGDKSFIVKFTLDRNELFNSREGAPYLMQTLDDWKQIIDDENNDD